MVIGGAISKRVGREEVAAFHANAVLALVLFVLVTFGVEDGLLATDTDNEPVPPNVTFDTEADHAADVGTFIPVRVLVVACVVNRCARDVVKRPVVSPHLVPDEVAAQPEESTVESDVDAEANLGMLVFDTRSLNQLHGECRNEFTIESLEGEERTGLGQEAEVAVVKEVLVFGAILDTGQAEADFEIDVAAELEVETTISLHNGSERVGIDLVRTARSLVATILVGNVDVQAPGVAASQRTAQEAVEVRHRFRGTGHLAVFANHGRRQVHGEFRDTSEEATDGKTRIGIVLVTQGDGEDSTKVREPRILVRAGRNVLSVRSELTNQVVRVQVDVRRVIKDAHVIHDIGSVLTHRFDTGECCECGSYAEDAESNTNCCSRS